MSARRTVAAALLLLGATAVILLMMGRPPICTCGTIALWHGALGAETAST